MAAPIIAKQLFGSKVIVLSVPDLTVTTTMMTVTMIDPHTVVGRRMTLLMFHAVEANTTTDVCIALSSIAFYANFKKDDRRSRRYDSYSDDSSRSRSRTPPKKERRKSTTEEVLKSIGLGGVAGAILGKKGGSRSRSRSRDRDHRARSRNGRGRSSSSSRSRGGKRDKSRGRAQVTEALKAALLAGVGEAVRARKEPGGWGGDKGKRVLTAAISAGGVDGILSHNRGDKDHSTRDVIGSAISGIATSRIVNGPRSKSRGRAGSPDSRNGRSQSHGGIGDLAAGGVLAGMGKKVYDSVRSRSRGRDEERGRARSRDSSYDSDDSRGPPPKRSRSQSVGAGLAKGLSAIGFNKAADKLDPERRKSKTYDDYDDRSDRNGGYRDSRDVGPLTPYAPAPGNPAANGPGPATGAPRSLSASRAPGGQYALDYGPHHTGDPETDSESDLGSSSGEEKERKKSRRKSILTAGLASVATIHAGNSIYQSAGKRQARKKALAEGDITQEQAKRERNKARLQDAASVGIAALGIKGAYSEWEEMREHNKKMKEDKEAMERHKQKRDARRKKADILAAERYKRSGYTGSMPNLARPSDYSHSDGGRSYTPPTHYYDDNPYGSYASPPPPPGAGFPPPPGAAYPPPGAGYTQPPPGPVYTPPPPNAQYPPGPMYTPPPPQHAPHDHYIPPPPMGPARSDTR